VEEDNEVFREARVAVLAKLKGLTTAQIPASALKSEKAWKGYLRERHGEEKDAQPTPPSSSAEPVKKSGSIFRHLGKVTKSLSKTTRGLPKRN